LFANYKRERSSFDNAFALTYGFFKTGQTPLRKSDDKIEISSKYGYQTGKHWYLATLLSFRSLLKPGFNFPNDSVKIADFLAPGYITLSSGMDYKPKEDFSFFLSPITGKVTIVNNTITDYILVHNIWYNADQVQIILGLKDMKHRYNQALADAGGLRGRSCSI